MKAGSVDRLRLRCPKCGYRIRGSDHDKGTHHRDKRPELRKQGEVGRPPGKG